MKSERSAAIALMAAALIGLIVANSPLGPGLFAVKDFYLSIDFLNLNLSMEKWVSDLLLAVFFLVAGLELKYELTSGMLSKAATAFVPVLAGIGGVTVPALVYLAFNPSGEYVNGWPIPTATDIAFALGILAIFGRGLPTSARIFLLALAIFDDLVAITIIAIFFTEDAQPVWLIATVAIAGAHIFAERNGKLPINLIRTITFILLWYTVYQSGVHATIAGVILGLIIPSKKTHALTNKIQPWTNTVVLPLFAFFSVGILLPTFEGDTSTVFLGIMIALPLGKLVGITAFAVLGNKIAKKDAKLDLATLDFMAISLLAGVGFTVSLLMTKLAFKGNEELIAEGTLGVVLGSLIAMTLGAVMAQYRGRYYMRKRRLEKKGQQDKA
jgi:NhaA family Na+:H+ antiporter